MIILNCSICKKDFQRYPYVLKSGRGKYCSKDCSNRDMSRIAKEKGYGKWALGRKQTQEYKKRHSEMAIANGFGKWMKGKSLSETTKQKISLALKGGNSGSFKKGVSVSPATQFKKGQTAHNQGKKLPMIQGENHYNWKGGITTETKKQRDRFHKYFTPKIFVRDDYTCQICKRRGVELQVDHIKRWSEYPELRFDFDNCRTLCKSCHYFITFGKPLTDESRRFGRWK